ncbi:MAG: response regulator transcription factor [Muribaculaceae bacterium]|nr:response regulator transcription factor [Muribaculaceae bacterium]MBR0494296.1 response regulator transcription factor [Muribaculaceae bacterium]
MSKIINILLAEDERTLAMIIQDTLDGQGFHVTVASDGEEALRLYAANKPDVIVADVMMPRLDGFELVRRIRKHDPLTPVIFLTARSAVNDVVHGFEMGANDYLKKPFGMQELIVRIKALLGRACTVTPQPEQATRFTIGQYLFDSVIQRLTHVPTGTQAELSYRESEILRRLCLHPSEVVTSQSLLLELWGDDSFFNNKSLHVFITKLRHRLGQDQRLRIVNVRGVGYKLISSE